MQHFLTKAVERSDVERNNTDPHPTDLDNQSEQSEDDPIQDTVTAIPSIKKIVHRTKGSPPLPRATSSSTTRIPTTPNQITSNTNAELKKINGSSRRPNGQLMRVIVVSLRN